MNLGHHGYVITTIVALFAVMGILTLPPVFLTVTADKSESERRRIAFQTTLAVFMTLVVSFFIGTYILQLFKIDMNAFEVAGALVVANMAWGMIMAKPSALFQTGGKNPAVIPLAIPKTAGPGAIATVIALNQEQSTEALLGNTFAIVVVTALAMLFMLASGRIEKVLGEGGLSIVSRVFGLLLLAIAVTSIMSSLLSYFPGLGA